MRLERVHIAGYKNLVDARLEFKADEMPITLIGNNGTGKSNLIEALLHIFVGLYYGRPPEFDFEIQYSAHGKTVRVENSAQQDHCEVTVDGQEWSNTRFGARLRHPQQRPPFPGQLFAYYSGTCDRVHSIIRGYNRTYVYKLRHQSDDLERQFVFSEVSQAEWILLGLIAHGHHELLKELDINEINQVKITLRSPSNYIRDRDDPSYWGTEGGIRAFLADLDNAAIERYEPFSSQGKRTGTETRVYEIKLDNLRQMGVVLERRGANLYSMLHALAARKILVKNEFNILQRNENTHSLYPTDALSEGEKQLLCVIGGLTLAQNTECLVLLDEPDTHLNPAWTWRYGSLLKKALTSQQRATSTAVIATHNPIMISGLKREQVFIARKTDEGLKYEPPVRDPQGQGVANILVSEYFGLPSSLDENTQSLLDERLKLAYKNEPLTDDEKARLKEINDQLDVLGLSISFRDPVYKDFEEQRFGEPRE